MHLVPARRRQLLDLYCRIETIRAELPGDGDVVVADVVVAADEASRCGEMAGPIDGAGIDVSGVGQGERRGTGRVIDDGWIVLDRDIPTGIPGGQQRDRRVIGSSHGETRDSWSRSGSSARNHWC